MLSGLDVDSPDEDDEDEAVLVGTCRDRTDESAILMKMELFSQGL